MITKLLHKKNNIDMISESQLISYKQNFTGKEFQWIKTDRPELIGKVVKCRDVSPNGTVVFDDGSSIHAKDLNNKLMMIHGDMKPLNRSEVESLYPPRPSATVSKLTPPTSDPVSTLESQIETPKATTNTATTTSTVPTVNPFEMFNSDETELNIKINIKLPDKKLLKLMYNNAENKEEFIGHLSDYVNNHINIDTIKDSIELMLAPSKKPTNSSIKSNIKITEIKDDK